MLFNYQKIRVNEPKQREIHTISVWFFLFSKSFNVYPPLRYWWLCICYHRNKTKTQNVPYRMKEKTVLWESNRKVEERAQRAEQPCWIQQISIYVCFIRSYAVWVKFIAMSLSENVNGLSVFLAFTLALSFHFQFSNRNGVCVQQLHGTCALCGCLTLTHCKRSWLFVSPFLRLLPGYRISR